MSKYTTELRYICETYAGKKESTGLGSVANVMEKARPKLFSFDYPIFDPEYKKPLETKIIRHFYLREIGLETVGQFKFFLEMKMNEIMPFYNQLYQSELLKFNPLMDFDYTETSKKTGSGTDQRDTTGSVRTGSQVDTESWADGQTTGNSTRNWGENDKTTGQEESDTTTHDEKEGSTTEKSTVTRTNQVDETVTGNSTVESSGTRNLSGSEMAKDTGTVKDAADNLKWNYFHDTPQGNLENITNNNYLTNATKDTEDLKNTRTNDLTRNVTREDDETTGGNETTNGKTITDRGENGKDITDTTGSESVTQDGTVHVEGSSHGTAEKKGDETGTESGTSEDHGVGKTVSTGTQESTGNVTGSFSTLDDYVRHVAGKSQGKSYSVMLKEFRSTFLNIDMMVIEDLEELFMGLY